MNNESLEIAASAMSGVRWSYLGGACSMLCSLVVGIVLARILGPRPYGQVILASTIYGFINLFVDCGFSPVLIQKESLDSNEVSKAFSWQVLIALNATGAVYLSAPWIARWFHDSSAASVIQAMSWMIAIQSIGLVSAALLRRRMRFRTIQCVGLASYVVAYVVVGIPLALLGAGVWSLVTAALCQCLLNAVLLYLATRHSLVPNFSLPDRSTATFSGTIVASNLVNWGHANLDNLAAAQLGPVALGLYGRACNFAYQPVGAVVTGLQSVLMSSIAKSQRRECETGRVAVCVMAVVFGVLSCAYSICAFVPETIIVGLFGEKWSGLIPLMVPLAIAMPLYGVHCLLGPILCGLGKPHLELWPQAISCAVAALALFAAARVSLLAIAWMLLGVTTLRLVLIASFAFRVLGIAWQTALGILLKRCGVAIACGWLAWSADEILRTPFHLTAAPRLLILAAFCAVGFASMVWYAGEAVFGRDAVEFLLGYAELFPASYVKQLRIQAHRSPSADFAPPESGQAAG